MKSIMVNENLHKWIMDHKDSERTSAEKVIYGLIGEVDCLKKRLEEVEKEEQNEIAIQRQHENLELSEVAPVPDA